MMDFMTNSYLVIGLGNPGKEYEGTRHNIGFVFVDKLCSRIEAGAWKNEDKFNAECCKGKIGKKQVIFAKPQTFMNLSGDAVLKLKRYYKVENEKIIIVSDDFNLETGQVRIRIGGESGGHNGLKSVIENIGDDFWRIRIGIGDAGPIPKDKYVLTKFASDEKQIVTMSVDKAVGELIESISQGKLENETISR